MPVSLLVASVLDSVLDSDILSNPFVMLAVSFLALALSASHVSSAGTGSTAPPAELYSSLVQQKVLKTAQSFPNPARYPQYTDRVEGDWIWFTPDQWTTGFFPATLYAMYERTKLCQYSNVGDASEWLSLARTWSTPEIPLEINTGVGHDVGFLSFPFMEELTVSVRCMIDLRAKADTIDRDPNNQTAVQAVNAFANHLAGRFSSIVGCTRSWDAADPTDFQVTGFVSMPRGADSHGHAFRRSS